ncbi:DUF1361 domain-containing protein [Litorihabitans aurantiacus]|uniref:Uncharacterized protein n=1 Tax=Litorihabitans aurantiacus TaxID=1930061 RepID=A0AA37XDA9_9MICO|nr:DUF1361 domain-containing protein [Litorihabitans aurantiacus]GMA30748.1 hypothetical protein GCM10025875_07400 [Litorihabitans aurantiacus]
MIVATLPAIAIGALCVLGVNLYAAAMIVLRAVRYRTPLYRPMLLNIVLSIVPIVLAVAGFVVVLVAQASFFGDPRFGWIGPTSFALAAAMFLAFFPNSAYLITELNFSHRKEGTACRCGSTSS